MRQPTVFIPHGAGPCFFMDWTRGSSDEWDATADWLRRLIPSLGERPKAILVVSGHWEEPVFTVGSAARPELIFDYYGFPEHTYQLAFEAPGAPDVAERVRELIVRAGLPARLDTERGWDHGVFIPLKVALPHADIPVVQLSLQEGLSAQAHLALGHALTPLREEGVLIVGSGMSWHNMRGFSPAFTERSKVFDRWLGEALAKPEGREDRLSRWVEAPHARDAHPREEHLAPLFVAAGAATGEAGRVAFTDQVMDVAISAFTFGG